MRGAPDGDRRAWTEAASAEVLARARRTIGARVSDRHLREAMLAAVAVGRLNRYPGRLSAPVHLPLLCAAAVDPAREPPLDLAVATALLWTGLELYDDLTDGDLAPYFRALPEAETTFAAFGLACVLPPALLADLALPPEAQRRVQRLTADLLLRAFAGQEADLRHVGGNDVAVATVEAAVRGKNGAPSALFAALGAAAAGAAEPVVEAYARYGEALGVVAQYQSDFWELFCDPGARDLVQRNRTLQIAAALELAGPEERRALLQSLDRASTDPAARDAVRASLRTGRNVAPWLRAVHAAAQAARDALLAAEPREPAATVLREQIEARTPFC